MLATIWFVLIFVLLAGYAILDGLDLGVGVIHLFARNDHERRVGINSIAPVWDGNEVWLLTAGGALFAAFPPVYATVFSAFYIALMLVLTGLVFRAVAMEYRSKVDSDRWRRTWDLAFGISSLLLSILLGVAIGNVVRGLPVQPDGSHNTTFVSLLNPFAVLCGLTTLSLFVMQGATYLANKSEGMLHDRCLRIARMTWLTSTILVPALVASAVVAAPHLLRPQYALQIVLGVVFLLVLLGGIVLAWRSLGSGNHKNAMVGTSAMIGGTLAFIASMMYPRLVPSTLSLADSLTVANASSTPRTLLAMLIIALIGMPLVLAYTTVVYRIFRGKVVLDEHSY